MAKPSFVHDLSCAREVFVHEASTSVESGRVKAQAAELWLCIYLARLAVDSLNPDSGKAAVVVVHRAGRVEVFDLNHHARARGIRASMPLSSALSLERDLNVYPRNLDAEQQKLVQIADWAFTWTDRVALYGEHAVLLGIQRSLRLFGGLNALLRKVAEGLVHFGCEYALAVAPAPKAAFWLAESSPGQVVEDLGALACALRNLPIDKLARDARHLARMQHSGIRTLADLMRLPRSGVARRFDAQTLETLDLALAKRPEALKPYSPAWSFSAQRFFDAPAWDLDLIRSQTRALLAEFESHLAQRQLATRAFHCEFRRESESLARIRVGCRRATHRAAQMSLLLEEHLHAVQLPAEITSIAIVCHDLEPRRPRQIDLFESTTTDEQSLSALLAQLEARLGSKALQRLSICADHRPERAFVVGASRTRQEPPAIPARPLWLLEAPQALDLQNGKPRWRGSLARLSGYERIEQGWWDGCEISRDYCIARNAQGSLLWIYRDRHRKTWFLHGVFG